MQRNRSGYTWVGVGLFVAFAAAGYVSMSGSEEPSTDPGSEPPPRTVSASRAPAASRAPGAAAREPTPPPAEPYREERLARLLLDGGPGGSGGERAAAAGRGSGPGEPSEPAAAQARPRPRARLLEPVTPETALRRAVFWRGLLERRIEEMERQLEEAREAGEGGRARQLARRLERLEAQRPGIAERIGELEAEAR